MPQIWTGGPEARYTTSVKPLTISLLRQLRTVAKERRSSLLPPSVSTEDVFDFDGSGIATAKCREGSAGDVQAAMLFNSLDAHYLDIIEKLDGSVGGDRLFLLVNPGWKDGPAALESWGFNLLQPRARQRAKSLIFGRDPPVRYDVTYACKRCTVDDHFCVSILAFPYNWQNYAYHLPERAEYEGCSPVYHLTPVSQRTFRSLPCIFFI